MELELARKRLLEERIRLEASRERRKLSEASERESLAELSVHDQHPADVGTETSEREKDVTILEMIEAQLAEVQYALRRLDEGTYGVCEACGKPIAEARLEARPAARFCVQDQAKAERQGRE